MGGGGVSGSLLRRTAIGATWMVAWRMVTRSLGLASTLVLARVLTPADFGVLGMATSFTMAVEALSQLGLQEALIRRGDGRGLWDTAFTLQAARAAITGALLALAAPAAADWFAEPRLRPVLLVLAGSTALAGVENIGIVDFRRDMRFDRQFALLSLPRLLQVMVAIPLALWLHSYWAMLAGIVTARLARIAMTYAAHPYRPRLRLDGWRALVGFSFWTWATFVVSLIWDRCDPFVLGPRIGTARLGVYLLALELASLPATELIDPAAAALFAGFAAAQREGENAMRAAPTVALALLMGVLPLIVTLSCGAGYVVAALLGPEWREAQGLVAILAWQGVFAPFGYVVGVTLVANGRVARNFIANLAASAIRLTALVTAVSLTRRLDIVAAVTAGCVAAEAVVFLLLLRGTGQMRLASLAGGLLRALLAAAAAVLVLRWCGLAWQPVTMASLPAFATGLLIGVIASLVFAAALLGCWWAAGRPEGPEALLTGFLAARLRASRRRPVRPLSTGPSE